MNQALNGLIHLAFGEARFVRESGVFVVFFGAFKFLVGDQLLLLGPALIYALEAPLDAAAGTADRFPID